MSELKIKQISNSGSPPDSYIAFNGARNIWQKIRHVVEFSSSDLIDGILTIQHDLGRKYVVVTVYDEADEQVIADQVKVFDDYVEINLGSFDVSDWVVMVS